MAYTIPDFNIGTQIGFKPAELLEALRSRRRANRSFFFGSNDHLKLSLPGEVLSMTARKQFESGRVYLLGFFDASMISTTSESPDISAGVNPKYLRQFLASAGADTYVLHDTNNPDEPKLSFLKPSEPHYFHLIMHSLWPG